MFRDKNDNRVVHAILPRLFKHVRRFRAHSNDIPVGKGPHRDVFAGISGIFKQRLPTAGVSTGTSAHACWPFTKETPQSCPDNSGEPSQVAPATHSIPPNSTANSPKIKKNRVF